MTGRISIPVLLFAFSVFSGPAADAQTYPNRPVTLVVPAPPGGAMDMLARLLAEGLEDRWDVSVVPEYRPGGGTVVGSDFVSRAEPDGYTLGIVVTSFVIHPSLRNDLPYTLADFQGITQIGEAPVVLLANPAFPADSLDDLVGEARARPGELAYAVSGAGTALHLAGELFARHAGIDWFHVPYAGVAEALPDVLSGRVPLLFDVWHSSRAYVDAGSLKVLGVASPGGVPGRTGLESMPQRFPGYAATSIQGLVAPAGTPEPVIASIAEAAIAVIRSPEFTGRLHEFGMNGVGSTPAAFEAFLVEETRRWSEIVRAVGLGPEE